MAYCYVDKRTPLVSVLLPARTNGGCLAETLRSVSGQTYPNLQVIVATKPANRTRDTVRSVNDPRFQLIEVPGNPSKGRLLNEALEFAQGEYVAYLADDAVYYSHHIHSLVDALETSADTQVTYSDFYITHCRFLPDGRPQVLAKHIPPIRDFDRYLLCRSSYVPHASIMHRRELLDRTGGYNERLRDLVEWDMIRRLAFFTDFLHLDRITGESLGGVGASDLSSDLPQTDCTEYLRSVQVIRSARPPKPWEKMPDLSIIFLPQRMDEDAAEALRRIFLWTFIPHQVYLPLPRSELSRVRTTYPNLIGVDVHSGASREVRVDEALKQCEGDHVAIVSPGIVIRPQWVEPALRSLTSTSSSNDGYLLGKIDDRNCSVVMRKEALLQARLTHPQLPLVQSIEAANIKLRDPLRGEPGVEFDRLLTEAEVLEREGDWLSAARAYEEMHRRCPRTLWSQQRAAWAFYRTGKHDERSLELCRTMNRRRPAVSSLLLEAKLHRRFGRTRQAVKLLQQAESILKRRE